MKTHSLESTKTTHSYLRLQLQKKKPAKKTAEGAIEMEEIILMQSQILEHIYEHP